MRILHIITSLELGGAEKLLTDIVKGQRESGDYVDVLVLYDKENNFFIDGAIVGKNNSKTSYKNIFDIASVIRKGKYDIVHSHLTHGQFWTALASFLDFSQYFSKNKRVYLTTEHSTHNNRRGKKVYQIIEKFLYGRYKKIICISKGVQESLKEWLGKEDENSLPVIENGVTLDRFIKGEPLARKEFELLDEDRVLIMVARLNEPKDHETLLKSMDLLPKKYKLLLVGDGPKKESLIQLGKELKLGNRVKFLGVRGDIEKLLKTSDIGVQSSHFEGFGLAAVEAMAGGIPVIASDVSGLRGIVEGAGILFKEGDSRDLAKKILELDRDEELRKNLIERGKRRAEDYSLDKTVEKYKLLYKKVLNRD